MTEVRLKSPLGVGYDMKIQHLLNLIATLLLAWGMPWGAGAATAAHGEAVTPVAKATASATRAATTAPASDQADQAEPIVDLKKAIREQMLGKKKLTLVISDKPQPAPKTGKSAAEPPISSTQDAPAHAAAPAHVTPTHTAVPTHEAPANAHPVAATAPAKPVARTVVVRPNASRDYIHAKAAALAGHDKPTAAQTHDASGHVSAHWSYAGATGPESWGTLQPEFGVCATGKRQSPINIEESNTLQGPAEPLLFNYTPSNGTVINNGHTVQVEVQGGNTLTVRGSNYALVQVHFHSPSEEQINFRHYAMVAHLVHQNAEGRLAVVAVLLEPGQANAFIDSVWTYMPLDENDQVRMPAGLFDLKGLLPQDQRYYQFLGSLTTPPCTEGVLWMVLKTPVQISAAQLRLFQQLYPNNARPVQPVNSRPVRSAQ